MEKNNIKDRIRMCAQSNGITILHSETGDVIDTSSVSSIDFVSFFVELENEFSIQIPDELFNFNVVLTVDYIEELINALCANMENYSNEI